MVFVTSTDKKKTQELLDAASSSPVLTVGETSDFLNQGGMIRFSTNNNGVGIVINNAAAAAKGIEVSAKLLSIATIYKEAKEK